MPIPIARREKIGLIIGALLSACLLIAAGLQVVKLSLTEVLGFITGALGVYLTVKSSAWNFPVGLANNVFFGILFFKSRLFNDFGLQIIYFGLGAWGWWYWTRVDTQKRGETLRVGRAGAAQITLSLLAVPVLTLMLATISKSLGGASPYLDALTTALSLVAQYLLGRKWVENWLFWIAADLIYVPLYISRELYLTGVLYTGFLLLCIWGFRSWKAGWKEQSRA